MDDFATLFESEPDQIDVPVCIQFSGDFCAAFALVIMCRNCDSIWKVSRVRRFYLFYMNKGILDSFVV